MLESRRKVTKDIPFEPIVCPSSLVTSTEVAADLESSGLTSVDIYEKYKEHIKTNRGGWACAIRDTISNFSSYFPNIDDTKVSMYVSYYNSVLGEQSYKVDKYLRLTSDLISGVEISYITLNTSDIPDSGYIYINRTGRGSNTLYYDSKVGATIHLSTPFIPSHNYDSMTVVKYVVKFTSNDTKRCIIFNHDIYLDSVNFGKEPVWVFLGKDIKYINESNLWWTTDIKYIHSEYRDRIESIHYFVNNGYSGAPTLTGNVTLPKYLKHLGGLNGYGLVGELIIPKTLESVYYGTLVYNSFDSILPEDELDQSLICPVYSNTLYSYHVTDSLKVQIYSGELVALFGARLNTTPLLIHPDTTKIGSRCFYHNSSRTCNGGQLVFPTNLTEIYNNAFNSCTGLSGQLVFNNNLTNIWDEVFFGCINLNNIDLEFPSGLLYIGAYAFYRCTGLSGDLSFPNSTTTIKSSAFSECINLGYHSSSGLYDGILYIGSGMTLIEERSFYQCNFIDINSDSISCREYDRVIYSYISGVLYSIYGARKYIGSLSLHPENETPGYEVQIIGNGCFDQNLRTGSIEIPNTVTKINNGAFYGCNSITGLTFEVTPIITEIEQGAFYCCGELTGNLIIPDSVITLGSSALNSVGVFEGMGYNLVGTSGSLTLGSSIITIGQYTFTSTKFNSIIWNGTPSVQFIYREAFSNMRYLAGTFSIPNSVILLGNNTSNIISNSGDGSLVLSNSSSNYQIDNNVIYNASGTILIGTCNQMGINSPIILSTCIYISEEAFYGANYSTSLSIPNTMNSGKSLGPNSINSSVIAGKYIKFYGETAPSLSVQSMEVNGKLKTVVGYTGYNVPYYTTYGITTVADIAALDAL